MLPKETTLFEGKSSIAKNIIAVTSGKGGVGKSTITVNLAVILAQMQYSVAILDADIYGPSVPRMLQTQHERLRWNRDNKIIPSENFGIKHISVAHTTPRHDTPLIWRSSVAVSAIKQLLDDVAWDYPDFLIIDMPPGTGDVQLTISQELAINAAILVSTAQMVATDDVSRALMMFKETNVPVAGIIENMSYFLAPDTKKRYDLFGKDGAKKMAQEYDVPFLGEIPLDPSIAQNCDSGTPICAVGTLFQKDFYAEIVKKLLKQPLFG